MLAGEIDNFPLLYHYRILERTSSYKAIEPEKHKRYVEYWNGNQNIGTYTNERRNAPYEIALFLEHIPGNFRNWLKENIDQTEAAINELKNTVSFLQNKGIIHFDVHFGNIVTDGTHPYLCDFGLVVDPAFDLTDVERTFLENHTHYDHGQLLLNLCWYLRSGLFMSLPADSKQRVMQAYGIDDSTSPAACNLILLKNIEAIHADGVFDNAQNYVELVIKHQGAMLEMQAFFTDMQHNDRKDTPFNNARVKRLLIESGFLEGAYEK